MTALCNSTIGETPLDLPVAMKETDDRPEPSCGLPAHYGRSAGPVPSVCDLPVSGEAASVRQRRGGTIFVIYDKLFLAECLRSVLQASLGVRVQIVSSLDQICDAEPQCERRLILFLFDALKPPEALDLVREGASLPNASVVVLSHVREQRLVREVVRCGAKAYIPMATGTAVAIEAVRFVLAGGTYFPPETLMGAGAGQVDPQELDANPITLRELSIIQAIQKGKSNKIIAYELKLCESTVKVHLRNIMRKLNAKNRTEVAVRSAEFVAAAPEIRRRA